MNNMNNQLDHIVIGAATLEQGVAWCEATLGVVAGPGGEHLHMGTHNRLLRICSDAFPAAYLEIIAIAPHLAAPTAQPRWFDLDNAAVQHSLQTRGPQLLHWVAQTTDIAAACAATEALGVNLGQPQSVSRMTPRGLLQWSFSVSSTGQRPVQGALPHLIEWANASPVTHMPQSELKLASVTIGGTPDVVNALEQCAAALQLPGVQIARAGATNTPALRVQLNTPKGVVWLDAIDLS